MAIIPINMHKSDAVRDAAETLYKQLAEQGYEVLLDDRDARPGFKFADCELLGIPHRLVVSDRNLKNDELEYRHRRDTEATTLKREDALKKLKESRIS